MALRRLDLHLFRVNDLRLAFAPVTDSLVLVDEAGWHALDLARQGTPESRLRREVASAHGAEAAARCLGELEALVAAHGLAERDPLETGEGPGSGADPSAVAGRAWLPSSPEAPLLKSLCLNVAHDCDLRCRYCFAGQGGFGGRRGLMRPETARAAVDLLLERSGGTGTVEIDFFGGEPLLNLGVVREAVDYGRRRAAAAGRSIGFTLTTNAAALGPEEAAYLAETMDNVVLSLDGRPEVHDRMRPFAGGRPSQATILANILRFVALRGERDYWVRGTYTAHNLDFTADVAYLARQGIRNISLEPVVGGGPKAATGWQLAEGHLPGLAEEYVRLAGFLDEEARAGRPLRFFHFIAETDSGPCFAKRVRGCGAGREYLAVTPEGELYPCHQFVGREGFGLGRVDGPGAAQGQETAGEGRLGRRVGSLWLGGKPACRACWARYRCSGGCHANGHAATGDLTRPDQMGCALMRMRLEASLYLQARRSLAAA